MSLSYLGLSIVLAAGISYLLTPISIRISALLGLIDHPCERRIHRQPIALAGGLSVFASCLGSLFVVLWLAGINTPLRLKYFALAAGILFVVGLIDDIKDIKPLFKLSGQLTATLVLFIGGISIGGLFDTSLPVHIDFVLTALWFLTIINAINLIDGLDGLATGLSCICALGLAASCVMQGKLLEAMLLTSLAGACLGFLRFNYPPARAFLGDSGSNFLGLCLAAGVVSGGSAGSVSYILPAALFILAIPLIDTTLAVCRRTLRYLNRLKRGEYSLPSIMRADLDHVHHRLIRQGNTTGETLLILYLSNASLVLAALLSQHLIWLRSGLYIGTALIIPIVVLKYLAHVEIGEILRLFTSRDRLLQQPLTISREQNSADYKQRQTEHG